MDERLQRALEFSQYTLTLNNQKRNIVNRVQQLQIVHHNAGVFLANQETIAFVKTLVDLGYTKETIMDSKQNSVKVTNLKELLDKLVSAYFSAAQELEVENEKLRKARTVKSMMDW